MIYCAADCESWLDTDVHPEYGYLERPPLPVCWSFAVLRKRSKLLIRDDAKPLLHKLLKDPNVTLVGQNFAFDLSAAIKWMGIPAKLVYREMKAGRVRDIMVREQLITCATGEMAFNPGLSYSQAALTLKYLDKDVSAQKKGEDVWRLRYRELDGVPVKDYPVGASSYALDDSEDCLSIFYEQQNVIDKLELSDEEEVFQTLSNFTCWKAGEMCPYVNEGTAVERFKRRHKKEVDRIQAPFFEHGFLRINKNRFKQYEIGDPRRVGYSENKSVFQKAVKQDYLMQGQKVPMTPPSKKFKQGQIKTDQETMLGCTSNALRKYGETAQDIKLVNAYVPLLERNKGRRVLPMYRVLLKTGRISCKNPSLQVIPRAPGARECFEPPKGYAFVCLDYDSMEMFGQAQNLYWMYGERVLLDALNDNLDPHIFVAAEIVGKSYDDAMQLYEEQDPFIDAVRQLAKIINFGAVGGMGPATFLSNMPEDVRDAMLELEGFDEGEYFHRLQSHNEDNYSDRVLEGWVKEHKSEILLKSMGDTLDRWKDTWNMHQYFTDMKRRAPWGKKFNYVHPWKGRKRGHIGYTDGCNLPMQSTCADAFKNQANAVMEEIMTPGTYLNEKQVELSVLLHDENVIAVPVEHVRKCATRIQTIMVEKAQEVMPDCKLRVGVEVTGEVWSKKGVSIDVYESLQDEGKTVAQYLKEQKETA